MGNVERHRPAAGFLRQGYEILGGAGNGIDVESANPEFADDRRADTAARAGDDGGTIAIERHGFLLCPAGTAA